MQDYVTVIELFAGIGAFSKALTNLGVKHKILDAVEIDKYAVQSFNAVHGTNFEPQDITKWDKTFDEPVDFIMHGSPCQDFSVAGRQAGGDKGSGTRSSLMYETLRIVEKLKPKCVIWENVKNLLSKKHRHNFDAYLDAMDKLGYKSKYKVLNAKDFGVPQNRERVFTVSILGENNFVFPEPIKLEKRLKDVLDDVVEEKYYLTDEQTKRLRATTYNSGKEEIRVQNIDGESRTLCARDYKDPKCVQVAQLYGFGKERNPQAGRVYDQDGICPTMSTMQGGNQEPKIVASRGRGDNNEQHLEPRNNMGVIELRTKNKRIIETAEKARFTEGTTAYLDVYNKTPRHDVTSTINAGTDSHQNNIIVKDFRIRKLTPKECWRLMGFADEDFEKAKNAGVSNSQLYKQAGNSIVVNCIQAIMHNVIGAMYGKE